MNSKPIGTHGSKTFREFLFHRINGSIDTHQGHDAKRDNGHSDTCPEFIAPDSTKGK